MVKEIGRVDVLLVLRGLQISDNLSSAQVEPFEVWPKPHRERRNRAQIKLARDEDRSSWTKRQHALVRPVFFKGPDETKRLLEHKEILNQFDRSRLNELLKFGCVYINSTRIRESDPRVGPTDTIKIFPVPKRFPMAKLTPRSILLDNQEIIAIDKPTGVPSIPVASNVIENCLTYFENYLGRSLYPLHRLDQGTSGILLFGKSPDVAARFHKDHQLGKIKKMYHCKTLKEVPIGKWTHFLSRGKDKMLCSDAETSESVKATLEVLKCEKDGEHYSSQIHLITGRTHQIRCQLAHLGSSIVGDDLYGDTSSESRIELYATGFEWGNVSISTVG